MSYSLLAAAAGSMIENTDFHSVGVVRIVGFHPKDPGSSPGAGNFIYFGDVTKVNNSLLMIMSPVELDARVVSMSPLAYMNNCYQLWVLPSRWAFHVWKSEQCTALSPYRYT